MPEQEVTLTLDVPEGWKVTGRMIEWRDNPHAAVLISRTSGPAVTTATGIDITMKYIELERTLPEALMREAKAMIEHTPERLQHAVDSVIEKGGGAITMPRDFYRDLCVSLAAVTAERDALREAAIYAMHQLDSLPIGHGTIHTEVSAARVRLRSVLVPDAATKDGAETAEDQPDLELHEHMGDHAKCRNLR